MPAHFTPRYFQFLHGLKRHNDRAWFAANKDRYVADVEAPRLQFIKDFAPRLKAISPAFVADARRMGGSMFRLHRDTRFSPDKSPFKTWTAARFPHEARRKVESVPAFYVHLGGDQSFGGGGMYHVDTAALTKVRRRMVDVPEEWHAVRKTGLAIEGEQLKRAPAGFPSSHPHLEDLKRKNLYTLIEFSEADAVAEGFLDRFVEACERAAPLVKFQTEALGLRW